jgi:hypothetical protein
MNYIQFFYTGNTSIADTGRFWKILVIPVLQILEDQYCRYWKILVKYWYYQYCVPVLSYASPFNKITAF